jgi:precorrin-2 dehydrogenase/sirohydrochlorin ferrochelatase
VKFYPINLNLKDKKVLIVGAGRVALRKFGRLLEAGAQIKIVSPEFNQGFEL